MQRRSTSSGLLRRGIIAVLQTPFDARGRVEEESLENLVEATIAAGVAGFLVPVVASEVAHLSPPERQQIVSRVATTNRGRVPLVVGASADRPLECVEYFRQASTVGATCLVAVPVALYGRPDSADTVLRFFGEVEARGGGLPLLVQDLQFHGPGLDVTTIVRLRETLRTLVGIKIETVPAGPKYSAVREACGEDFFVCGGWAIPQMIEALDRGVDAMIPESSMVSVYAAIDSAYRSGNRAHALEIFRALQPVLCFANQNLITSIEFCKRLLVRKGIFRTAHTRMDGFRWDRHSERVADELIDHYLELEARVAVA